MTDIQFSIQLAEGTSHLTDLLGDILMEALIWHPLATDPIISGSLAAGEIRVRFELPEPSGETCSWQRCDFPASIDDRCIAHRRETNN